MKKELKVKEEIKNKFQGESYTIDIRETHGDMVTREDVAVIEKRLESEGRSLKQLYCTDKQRESLKEVIKDVILTVE